MKNNNDPTLFIENSPGKSQISRSDKNNNCWKIVIVDDDRSIHQVTRLALDNFTFLGMGLSFLSAYSAKEARMVIQANPDVAVVLLDIVMEEENSGLEVVRYIREQLKNNCCRIILRTGQPGQAPENKIVADYDIHDYKVKTELTTQKLFTMMTTALRSYHEITDAIRSRNELEEERSIFIKGPVSVFKWLNKPGFPVVYFSPNVKKLLGYSAEELVRGGVKYSDLIHHEDAKSILKVLKKWPGQKDTDFEQEYRIVRKDKKIIWLHAYISPIRDTQNKITHCIGYILDATRQKEQEKLIFEKMIEGIIITDLNNGVLKVNQVMREMFGKSAKRLESRNLLELVHHKYHQRYLELRDLVKETGNVQKMEVSMRISENHFTPCWLSISPVRDLSDKVKGFFILLRDLSERRGIEKELRTALEAEKRFIASVSHEIRTPLSSILGYTELMNSSRELNEEQKKYCNNISINSKHLLTLINDILDISKIEADQLELTETKTNLSEVLTECGVMISSKIKEGVKLEVIIDEFDYYFMCDPVRIKQIFINLLGNAAKFTSSGVIKLYLKNYKELPDNKIRLWICVEDTGIGIPQDKQKNLFKAFKQAHVGEQGGTGLGLYLSKSIAQLMGGDIEVKSKVSKGSEFVVSLVLKKGEDKDEAYDFSGKKILLIENDPLLSRLLQDKLEYVGARLILLRDLEDTSDVFRRALSMDHLDAVVIDIDILKSKSVYIAGALREIFPEVVIIGIKKESNPLYFDEISTVILKPFSFYQLGRELKKGFGQLHKRKINYSNIKVLLADDIEINRQLFSQMFQKFFNIQPRLAINGQEIIEAHKKDDFDIIFMDIQMPILNGIEATREIRKIDKKIKIIALTGNVVAEEISLTQDAGMDGFLSKPIQKDDIAVFLDPLAQIENKEFPFQLHQIEPGGNTQSSPNYKEHIYNFINSLSDDESITNELVDVTIHEIQTLLEKCKISFENKEKEPVTKILHALKGVLYNCGLENLGRSVQEIEAFFHNNVESRHYDHYKDVFIEQFEEFLKY